MAALLGVALSILKSVLTLRGVIGTIMALGHGAARNIAQRDAYYHGVDRDLIFWIGGGAACLALTNWSFFSRKTRRVWIPIWVVTLAMAAAAFYTLEHFKAVIERI
ncbi:MAG: hypothetical protein JWO82_2719 [Akkermansiaceae bacterium]|nr:hypothetical protein [Akkermansiaceae bacterium]